MSHAEVIERVLECQDMLREGLAVRESLHRVLNDLLTAKAEEVERYARLSVAQLSPEEGALKEVWAKARHAVSNPLGGAEALHEQESFNTSDPQLLGEASRG